MRTPCLLLLHIAMSLPVAVTAQPPKPTHQFHAEITPGMSIGGINLSKDAVVEGLAVSDNGNMAFVVSSKENGKERTAVFTRSRLVATDGITLGGQPITRILGSSLQVNDSDTVVFEAQTASGAIGIFREREFVIFLAGRDSPSDFILLENNALVPREGVIALPNTIQAGKPGDDGKSKKKGILSGLVIGVRQTAIDEMWRRMTGLSGPPVTLNPGPTQPSVQPVGPIPQPPTAQPKVTQPAMLPAKDRVCPVPAFPVPTEWLAGGQARGPARTLLFDAPNPGRVFESKFFTKMTLPYRMIFFNSDCAALAVAVVQKDQNRLELWGPAGLITLTSPEDGSLLLPGVEGKATSPALAEMGSSLRINGHGQIAFVVRLQPEGWAIVTGTPGNR